MVDTTFQKSLESLVTEYKKRNRLSREMFERAKKSLPGGNTRTGVYTDPFPIYADQGEGAHLIDLDGHRLLDFVNNNTALILGHAHPSVVEALKNQVEKGTGFSRPLALEVEMAELLRDRIPSMELIRFCSSGTEAVMNSLRAARAFTGKKKIAKFEGAYHGMDEAMMISYVPPLGPHLGPAHCPYNYPSSAGLTPSTFQEVVILPFNNQEACEKIIFEIADDLAAVIVDPLSTAAGMTLPLNGFLSHLREITKQAKVLLIFDEIISFRTSRGGAQELFDVQPDLTCLGKVVAGGTPGSVFGGRKDVLSLYDPTSGSPKIPQSGTYNANALALMAGLVTLKALTPEAYKKLNVSTQKLGANLEVIFKEAGIQAQITTIGSLFRIHFLPKIPCNYREAAKEDQLLHKWLFFWLINHGIYWKQGGNISLATEDQHVDQLVSEVNTAIQHIPTSYRSSI